MPIHQEETRRGGTNDVADGTAAPLLQEVPQAQGGMSAPTIRALTDDEPPIPVWHVVDHEKEAGGPQLHDGPTGPPCSPHEFDDSLAKKKLEIVGPQLHDGPSGPPCSPQEFDDNLEKERARAAATSVAPGPRPPSPRSPAPEGGPGRGAGAEPQGSRQLGVDGAALVRDESGASLPQASLVPEDQVFYGFVVTDEPVYEAVRVVPGEPEDDHEDEHEDEHEGEHEDEEEDEREDKDEDKDEDGGREADGGDGGGKPSWVRYNILTVVMICLVATAINLAIWSASGESVPGDGDVSPPSAVPDPENTSSSFPPWATALIAALGAVVLIGLPLAYFAYRRGAASTRSSQVQTVAGRRDDIEEAWDGSSQSSRVRPEAGRRDDIEEAWDGCDSGPAQYLDEVQVEEVDDVGGQRFDSRVREATMYDTQDFSSFKKVSYEKSEDTRALIYESIKNNDLFEDVSKEEFVSLIDVFKPVSHKRGDKVITRGSTGDEFYVVESGSLSIHMQVDGQDESANPTKNEDYKRGSTFGELALIFGSPQAATIIATTDVKLWTLDRETYRNLISQIRYEEQQRKREFLKSCFVSGQHFGDIFETWQIEDLTIAMKIDQFKKGDVILREGELGDTMFVIRTGTVESSLKGKPQMSIGEKKVFGTTSLTKGNVAPYTYTAATELSVYYLTKDDFEEIIGFLPGPNTVAPPTIWESRRALGSSLQLRTELTLNDLTTHKLLGKGGFGKVILAEAKDTKHLFALKILTKDYICKKKQEEHVLNEYSIMKMLTEMQHAES